MKLWHLYRIDQTAWQLRHSDETDSLVVRACCEYRARQLAAASGNEKLWLDAGMSQCVTLLEDGDEGVIIRSFNAA